MAGDAPGVPSSSKIVGAVGEQLEQRLALLLAAEDVVGADVGQGGHAVDGAVDGDDRDAGVDGFLDRRRHAVGRDRADQEAVDLLGDGGFDVSGLLGHLVLAVQRADLTCPVLRPRP